MECGQKQVCSSGTVGLDLLKTVDLYGSSENLLEKIVSEKNRTVKLHVLCPSLAVACTACTVKILCVYVLLIFLMLNFCPLSTLKSLETEMEPGQDF